jgi:hypothetical protein
MRVVPLAAGCLFACHATHAAEWSFGLGVAYVTGIDDVADHYEENLARAGFDADVEVRVPIGLNARATYSWNSDARVDLGLGPMFFISGDVKHLELPVTTTIGYSFLSGTGFSPYVRAGLSYHYVDGDQYSDASPGLFAAAGIDFTHFTLEIASDRSEVELDALRCTAPGACRLTTRELRTYEWVASVFYRFR